MNKCFTTILRSIVVFGITILFLWFPSNIFAQVVINEFLPDASPEWVEFYNSSDSAEYIKSYYLDDDTDFTSDAGSSSKKVLSELNISNVTFPYIEISSFLNNSGDFVVLFNSDGALIDQYQYSSNPGSGVSIGRYPDRTGSFDVLSSPTKGTANSAPVPTSTPTPAATGEQNSCGGTCGSDSNCANGLVCYGGYCRNSSCQSDTDCICSTSTPMPILTLTPTPTKIPVLTKTPTSTPTSGSEEVLGIQGEQSVSPSATPMPQEGLNSKFPFFAILLIIGGVTCMGLPIFVLLKKGGKSYNEIHEENN